MSGARGFTHESQDAKSIEWYTPPWVFDELGLQFDIDVCAPKGGISWIPACRHFHKEDDGLQQPWVGTVWCNPPYGRETTLWLKRMSEHKDGVALVFSRTDCAWFHEYAASADSILFLRGRIRFVDGAGATGGSGAGNGSMLCAWGAKSVAALDWMALMGHGFLCKKGFEL